MIIRFLFCSLFILGLTTNTRAQLQKGSWLINGEIGYSSFSLNRGSGPETFFRLLIEPELSLMVTKQLMLGGKLSIGLNGDNDRRTAPVSQQLLIRHYFKNLENIYLFYGGELVFRKVTQTFQGGGNRTFRERSGHLQGGMLLFFQKAIALEFLFDYEMISIIKENSIGGVLIDNGHLLLEGRFQFFIHPTDKSNLEQADYRFYPGNWLVGGNFQFGGNDFIRPEIHRFWGSGWTTGFRTEVGYSSRASFLGCTSLFRKYFRPDKKGKIWLQVGAGIQGNYRRIRDNLTNEESWITNSRNLSLEGTIGWSNYISSNFTIDFFISRQYEKSYPRIGPIEELNVLRTGVVLSGVVN
jgi:hypothetical protein